MAEYYTSTKHFRKKVGKSQTVPTTDYTPYDPIEIARQYAPKFDKPVVDMVEVVRCRDCKWYREGEHFAPTKFCFRLKDEKGKEIGYNFASDDYCSRGERKESE